MPYPPQPEARIISKGLQAEYPPIYSEGEVEAIKGLGIKFVEWNGILLAIGQGFSTEWFDEISNRLKERKSVIIAVTGAPGEGKTYDAMRTAQIFDRGFTIKKQMCFRREKVARIISGEIKLRAGQAIIIDEAHMAAGSRHWTDDMQKEIVDQIAAIRSRGFLVFIVVLHISMIDNILRDFVLTYQAHMEDRGIATVYKLSMPRFEHKIYRERKTVFQSSLPGEDECLSPKCIECSFLNRTDDLRCMNIRAEYEREKYAFLSETSNEAVERMKKKKEKSMSQTEKIALVLKNKEMLRFTTKGTIHHASIQDIFEKEGNPVGESQAHILAQRVLWKHPELSPKPLV